MDRSKIILLALVTVFFLGLASGFHKDALGGGHGGGGISGGHGSYYGGYGHDYLYLDDPRKAITHFVAPFLLIAILFQRGYEKALTFTFADNDEYNTFPSTRDEEKERVKRYSMLMALATAGIIVPTPWFQFVRLWVANLFSLIGILFFGAIFAAFIWILWKVFS